MMLHCMGGVLAESGELRPDQWLLIIAAIVIITLLFMQSSRRRAVNGSPKQYRREIDSATTKSASIKQDMERLLVELSELARQINGQIDTRYAKLEQSIADADKRIQFLRVLLAAAKKANLVESDGSEEVAESPAETRAECAVASGGLDARVGDDGVSVSSAPEPERARSDNGACVPHPQRGRGTQAHDAEGAGADKATVSAQSGASEAGSDDGDVVEDEGGIDEISRRAYALSDEGRTPVQIAQELGHNLGEVELILNLRSQSAAQHSPPTT